MGFLIKGDVLVVNKLDRLGRSLEHLLKLFRWFEEKEINFVSITENLDTSTPTGKMHFQMIGVFSEFERNLISERTKEGQATARKNGKIFGRQKILNAEQKELIDRFVELGKSKYEIARCIGIKSRTPIYKLYKQERRILMDWLQILVMIGTNIGFVTILFLWNRSESRSDYRHMEARTDALLKAIQDEMKSFHIRYMEETKNFHARLCVIEENRK